jgi:hypothetical protein
MGLATWLAHFLSTLSASPSLHLISVGLWVKAQHGLKKLRATVNGRHVSVRTIEALSNLPSSSVDEIQCQVVKLSPTLCMLFDVEPRLA